ILRLATPLTPNTAYRLKAIDLRGIWGNPRTSDRVFSTPKPAPADTTRPAPVVPRPARQSAPPAPAARPPR
ncbi:MAG TPA: hypothetical protein VF761_18330, partial [Gemmatimonadaceae bacterium]